MGSMIYDDNYRTLVLRLKTARKGLGLTQPQAGKLVGKSRTWLSKIETFEVRLDMLCFIRLCRVLKLKPVRLVRQMEKGLS